MTGNPWIPVNRRRGPWLPEPADRIAVALELIARDLDRIATVLELEVEITPARAVTP